MGGEELIFALGAAKLQLLLVKFQIHGVSFGKIGLTIRIFNHDIINLPGLFARNRF